jgi:hypothetical protein
VKAVAHLRDRFGVDPILRVLDVAPSSFYGLQGDRVAELVELLPDVGQLACGPVEHADQLQHRAWGARDPHHPAAAPTRSHEHRTGFREWRFVSVSPRSFTERPRCTDR